MFRSTSSTAALGFILLPVYVLGLFIVAALLANLCMRGLLRLSAPGRQYLGFMMVALPVLITGCGLFYLLLGIATSYTINTILRMNAQQLTGYYQQLTNTAYYYPFKVAAVAQNGSATPQLLDTIAHGSDPRLNDSLFSLFDINGNNHKGISVIRLVANHPNALPNTLAYLATSSNESLLTSIAANPNTPEAILIKLYDKKSDLVAFGLVANPKTPKFLLDKLSQSEDKYVRMQIVERYRREKARQ